MRDELMEKNIIKAMEWIYSWEGSQMRKMEALWIIRDQLEKYGRIQTTEIYRLRISTLSQFQENGFVPSKYGGKTGSVIYTSEAAGLCYKNDMGNRFAKWVIEKQMGDGFWTEEVTDFFPKNKSWYFTKSMKYWVTATVIINMRSYYSVYEESFDFAIQGLKDAISIINEKVHMVKPEYLSQFLQFFDMDIWTLTHIWHAVYVSGNKTECKMCEYLVNMICQNDAMDSYNTDILQNILFANIDCVDIGQEEKLISNIAKAIIDRQNEDGSWGYQHIESDVTLTAYVLRALSLYKEGKYEKRKYKKHPIR